MGGAGDKLPLLFQAFRHWADRDFKKQQYQHQHAGDARQGNPQAGQEKGTQGGKVPAAVQEDQ